MGTEIWVALITGAASVAGVIITVIWGNKKNAKKVEEQSNLTLYRLSELETKVDKHNHLVERMYALEESQKVMDEKMKVANHRIDDLEHFHKG